MKIYTYLENQQELILVDGRNNDASRYSDHLIIKTLCSYYGLSGLILLSKSDAADFKMEQFACDGHPESGSAVASAVSFADLLGIKGFYADYYFVETTDGIIRADIISRYGEEKTVSLPDGSTKTALCQGEFCGD